MKARVKATGEIIELCNMEFDEDGNDYWRDELELIGDYEPDYWEKLHHQAAIAAMSAFLVRGCEPKEIAQLSLELAGVMVMKLKEENICEK